MDEEEKGPARCLPSPIKIYVVKVAVLFYSKRKKSYDTATEATKSQKLPSRSLNEEWRSTFGSMTEPGRCSIYAGRVLKKVTATRYVLPLREGGSLPGLVEADDLGMYVVKFIGAGQGRKTLIAEVITGELGRTLGLPVPELAQVEFDAVIGRGEPDPEIQELLRASGGINLGMDFLPGSLGFDPLSFEVTPVLAGQVLWLDAFTGNVDRSWRNPNMLVWHGEPYLIDHGATLIFHHNWDNANRFITRPYDSSDHVLSTFSPDLMAADVDLAPKISEELLRGVVSLVPDQWLVDEPGFTSVDEVREAYVHHLLARVTDRAWLPEVSG